MTLDKLNKARCIIDMPTELQLFSFDAQVTAEAGIHDKIQLTVALGHVSGTVQEIDLFRSFLGSPSKTDRRVISEDDWDGHGWIFNRPSQSKTMRHPLSIRSRRLKLKNNTFLPKPLFGGRLSFTNYYKANHQDCRRSSLSLTLSINPTRFCRHQFPILDIDSLQGYSRLLYSESVRKCRIYEEFSLDGNDNWLPNISDSNYTSAFWKVLVKKYVDGTLSRITEELKHASSQSEADWQPESNVVNKIHTVETYWEFKSLNPLKGVLMCEPLLRRYSENNCKVQYYKTPPNDLTTHNSRVVTVMIRTGVDLVLYAKTNQRMRFEVRHNLNQCSKILRGKTLTKGPLGVTRILAAVRKDACTILNEVLRFMKSRNTFPTDSYSVGELLYNFVQAVGRWETAGALLSMLIANRKIVIDDSIKPQVHALKKAGIVIPQRRNQRRLYIISGQYERAFDSLSANNNPLLAPRERQRKFTPNRASDKG